MNLDKAEVLKNGAYNYFIRLKSDLYNYYHDSMGNDTESSFPIGQYERQLESEFLLQYDSMVFDTCRKLYNSSRQKVGRLKRKLEYWVTLAPCYFLTITFNDSAFENTTKKSRRTYVQRFLKNADCLYCANIDYGDLNGREHYHAVICVKAQLKGDSLYYKNSYFLTNTLLHEAWDYGFLSVQPLSFSDSTPKKVSKYIAKLSNHALKETALSQRLMVNNKKPEWVSNIQKMKRS